MFRFIFICILFCSCLVNARENVESNHSFAEKPFAFGINLGGGWAFEDKAHLFNTYVGVIFDYRVRDQLFIQLAPGYSYLWRWKEHYLTIPVHIRVRPGEKFSVFAGPALTFDIGYFKDLGISAGMYYHFTQRSALIFSAFTFTLFDYHIDYFYMPLNLSYNYTF